MTPPPRILMVSRRRISPTVASGTAHFMRKALERHVGAVDVLDNMAPVRNLTGALRRDPDVLLRLAVLAGRLARWRLAGKRYDWDRSRILSVYYARRIRRHLASHPPYDFMFVDKGFVEVAMAENSCPIVYSHDAVTADMTDYSSFHRNLPAVCRAEVAWMERAAVARSVVCVYSSRWAAESARRHIGLPSSRIRVVHNGPNLDGDPASETGMPVPRPHPQECRLLLVGGDWHRKGCDTAAACVERLNSRGITSSLTICGCEPPGGESLPPCVRVIPGLRKNDPTELARLIALFRDASFLILPSRRECSAVVLIEASLFGLPAVCADVGGNSDTVRDGITGALLPADADGHAYAERVAAVMRDDSLYCQMSKAARRLHLEELNWTVWANGILDAWTAASSRPSGTEGPSHA